MAVPGKILARGSGAAFENFGFARLEEVVVASSESSHARTDCLSAACWYLHVLRNAMNIHFKTLTDELLFSALYHFGTIKI